jgi:hypothetical protein
MIQLVRQEVNRGWAELADGRSGGNVDGFADVGIGKQLNEGGTGRLGFRSDLAEGIDESRTRFFIFLG